MVVVGDASDGGAHPDPGDATDDPGGTDGAGTADGAGLPPVAAARRAAALEIVRQQGTVRVTDLARRLGASPVTVRRDLAVLADEGRVRRVHGGAVHIGDAPRDVTARRHDARRARPGTLGPRPTGAVGMLVPSLEYYWPGVVRGAEDEARQRGVRIFLRGSSYEVEDERPALVRLVGLPALRGLLAAPATASPHAEDTLAWLAQAPVPVVLVEREGAPGPSGAPMESVRTDHRLGAATGVQHLLDLGHRRVGLVRNRRSPTSPAVRAGWVRALGAAGLPAPEQVDLEVGDPYGRGTSAELDVVVEMFLRHGVTAALVHADADAIALVQRAEEHGVRVPTDLSVVAYDDEVAALAHPALTAVRPPRRTVGRTALELLARRLADPGRPVHRVLVTPTLQIRDSTTPPP